MRTGDSGAYSADYTLAAMRLLDYLGYAAGLLGKRNDPVGRGRFEGAWSVAADAGAIRLLIARGALDGFAARIKKWGGES